MIYFDESDAEIIIFRNKIQQIYLINAPERSEKACWKQGEVRVIAGRIAYQLMCNQQIDMLYVATHMLRQMGGRCPYPPGDGPGMPGFDTGGHYVGRGSNGIYEQYVRKHRG